jgi:cystathionine beta-synthase
MRTQCISQLPVLNNNYLAGILTEDHLLHFLSSTDAVDEKVGAIMERSVPTVELNTPISSLQGAIMKSGLAIVLDKHNHPLHILTKIDLVEWMSKKV